MQPRALDVVGTLVRLGLAALWLVSGVVKALDPDQTYVAVRAYDVLARGAVGPVAAVLPWLEITLGVLLLLGIAVRALAGFSLLLLVVFVIGMAQAWVRGLSIGCGCFGGGGTVEPGQTAYVQEMLRDVGFMLFAGWLLVRPRTLAAAENRMVSEGTNA